MTIPMIMDQIPNWSLSTMWKIVNGCWNMVRKGFHLATWTTSWLKHGMPSRCQLETSSIKSYPPPQPSWLNNKYPGMCCLRKIVFWSQVWRNKQYITPYSCTYQVTVYQYRWYYGCPPRKGYAKIIEEYFSKSCSVWRCEKKKSEPN